MKSSRSSEKRMKRSYVDMKDALFRTMERLEAIHGKHSGVTGVRRLFRMRDNLTGGFQGSI